MFGFFKKKQETAAEPVKELKAIVNGRALALEEVPDEIFSSKALGDGIAFAAEDSIIVAPCDCTVETMNDDMKHAIGLKLSNGMELLIHVGVDTVKLQGEGFKQLSKEGAKVKAGDLLLEFDKAVIKKNGLCDYIMLIVTDDGGVSGCSFYPGNVTKGESVVAQW